MKKLLIALSVLAVSTSTFAQPQKSISQVVKVRYFEMEGEVEFYTLKTNKGEFQIDVYSLKDSNWKVLNNAAKKKSCVQLTGKVSPDATSWVQNAAAKSVKCPKK